MSVTIAELLKQVELPESETPSLDAEVLLCHALGKDRVYLYTWPEACPTSDQMADYLSMLARRQQGEPIAYIVGVREFWSLPLKVNKSTLIPRPDTERLVEVALDTLDDKELNVVDLGTGTGAIALALASERPHWDIIGVDQSESAVKLARENAEMNHLERVRFQVGSWCAGLPNDYFDLVVSNPPYIVESDPHLSQGDVRFEPSSALVSPQNGLLDITLIAGQVHGSLRQGGWLMIEHGFDQAQAVRKLFSESGYQAVESFKDLSGNDRVTIARKPSEVTEVGGGVEQ